SRQDHSHQKASPVLGSTAAYNQYDSYSGSTTWRGFTPKPVTRRRVGRWRPSRLSSWQNTRTGWSDVCRPKVAMVPKRRGHCLIKSAASAAFFGMAGPGALQLGLELVVHNAVEGLIGHLQRKRLAEPLLDGPIAGKAAGGGQARL